MSRASLNTAGIPGRSIESWYDEAHSHRILESADFFYRRIGSDVELPVLDVACGLGGLFSSCQGVGCDISTRALEESASEHPSSSFARADAHSLPFKNSTFRTVVCLGALEHFQDQRRALLEMNRVLKDSGILIITITNRLRWTRIGTMFSKETLKQPIHHALSIREATILLGRAGFLVLEIRRANQFQVYEPLRGVLIKAFRYVEQVCPLTLSIEPIYVCTRLTTPGVSG